MRMYWIQHVGFEGLGQIASWAKRRSVICSKTLMGTGTALPSVVDFDFLIVMGGPMSVYEPEEFPWLSEEKTLIRQAIESGKRVLGICLGAQLIADVLGGRVYRGLHRELGWHDATLTGDGQGSALLKGVPEVFKAFHWHGDTFDIPPGCNNLVETSAFRNQAFEYDGRVLALQFHLECTAESIEILMYNCAHDFCEGPHVQHPLDIRKCSDYYSRRSRPLMDGILNNLVSGLG